MQYVSHQEEEEEEEREENTWLKSLLLSRIVREMSIECIIAKQDAMPRGARRTFSKTQKNRNAL